MDVCHWLRLVAQSGFEEELRLAVLGIGRVLEDRKGLNVAGANLVGQTIAGDQVEHGERLTRDTAIFDQRPLAHMQHLQRRGKTDEQAAMKAPERLTIRPPMPV